MAKHPPSGTPASHPAHPRPDLPQATWGAIEAVVGELVASSPGSPPGFVAIARACRAARRAGRIPGCSNQQLDAALKHLADAGELGTDRSAPTIDDSTPELAPAPPASDPLKIHINRFLDVVYDKQAGRARVLVGGKPFLHCAFVVADIDPDKESNRNIGSIDDLAASLAHDARVLEGPDVRQYLSPAEEILAHASNLQAWAENGYDTRLLHSNIAFPLLKELAKAGDETAARVFEMEIESRLRGGTYAIRELIVRELCDYLTEAQWLFLASQPCAGTRHLAAWYAVLTPPVLAALTSSQHLDNQHVLDAIELRRRKNCMDRMPVIIINNPYATYANGIKHVLRGDLTIVMYPSEYDDQVIPLDFEQHIDFRGNEDLIQHLRVENRRNEYSDAWLYPNIETRIRSLAKFVNLETLQLDSCGMASLPDMTGCHALSHIDVSCNHLESVEQLASAVNLVSINASRNYIRSLHGIEHLTQLVRIDFSRNEIESMKEIALLTKLNGLHFRFNKIKKLEGLHLLNALEDIDLVVNEIQDVDETVLSDIERIAPKLGELGMFTLSNNPIVANKPLVKKIKEAIRRGNPTYNKIGAEIVDPRWLD